MAKRVWHFGPPPFPGWWNASISRRHDMWRWWNGSWWSSAVEDKCKAEVAAKAALFSAQMGVEWTNYYPKNARVPRIDPNKEPK